MIHYVKDYSEITYSLKSWNVAGAVFIGMFDESIRKLQEDNHIPLILRTVTVRSAASQMWGSMTMRAENWQPGIFLRTDTGTWRSMARRCWIMELSRTG